MFKRLILCSLGVSLVHRVDGGVGVASVPAVLVQREASELTRGRPSVALDLVQVMEVYKQRVFRSALSDPSLEFQVTLDQL